MLRFCLISLFKCQVLNLFNRAYYGIQILSDNFTDKRYIIILFAFSFIF